MYLRRQLNLEENEHMDVWVSALNKIRISNSIFQSGSSDQVVFVLRLFVFMIVVNYESATSL